MVSGLDDSLGGEDDAPLLRSVIVVVASVPWRAPEERRGRMAGDERGKAMALAPACPMPVNDRDVDNYGLLHYDFSFYTLTHRMMDTDVSFLLSYH